MRRISFVTLLGPLLLAGASAVSAAASSSSTVTTSAVPDDAAIAAILRQRLGPLGDGPGIVVGVVGPQRRSVIAAGHRRAGPFTGQTRFEIGSITKVFTALLLADMVERHEVDFDAPVARYLPAALAPAAAAGRPITLLDLATHTSGLPFMPPEMAAATDLATLRYERAQLVALVHGAKVESGAPWSYSNIGYWLLGEALAARDGAELDALVDARVLTPLGLGSTSFTPTARDDLADGHDARLRMASPVVSVPVFALMPAAGGLLSNADDLVRFLEQVLDLRPSPLAPAMAAMLRTRRATGEANVAQAIGWEVIGPPGDELVVHDGGTLGFTSAIAWDPRARTGVVVLSNQVTTTVGDIARHLLRPAMPLQAPPAPPPREVAVSASALDACVGTYEAAGEGRFLVAREGDHLTISLPDDWGLPRLRLHPSSAREFFVDELPLRASFRLDRRGHATAVVVVPPRDQRGIEAKRVTPP